MQPNRDVAFRGLEPRGPLPGVDPMSPDARSRRRRPLQMTQIGGFGRHPIAKSGHPTGADSRQRCRSVSDRILAHRISHGRGPCVTLARAEAAGRAARCVRRDRAGLRRRPTSAFLWQRSRYTGVTSQRFARGDKWRGRTADETHGRGSAEAASGSTRAGRTS